MSYILTSVYPTATGDSAAHYAAKLALELGIPLRIIYPYTVPVAIGEMPMPLLPVEEVRDAANARLTEIEQSFRLKYPGLALSSGIEYGNLVDLLMDIGGNEPDKISVPLLAVISNDVSEEADTWMGGESASILREGKIPVLAVSGSARYKKPQQICLACDSRTVDEGLAPDVLRVLRQKLQVSITVLHVADANGETSFGYEGSKLQSQLDELATGYAEVSVRGNIDEAIADFADTHNVDWLALAPHHYGFWEGLFHKSHTSRLLHMAHVPVLALHG